MKINGHVETFDLLVFFNAEMKAYRGLNVTYNYTCQLGSIVTNLFVYYIVKLMST